MKALEATESPSEEPREAKRRSRKRSTRGSILWVDDDPNLTAAATRRLRRKGYEVLPASDGMQGYWQAVTRKPDVIVTDLRMPRWEGRDLLECLLSNAQTAGVPVIVASGYANPEETRRLQQMGVYQVLEKPIPWNQLLRVLKDLTTR